MRRVLNAYSAAFATLLVCHVTLLLANLANTIVYFCLFTAASSFGLLKMGCGASKKNVVAPESATIEARPKTSTADVQQVTSSSEPVIAEGSVPPSPTPSERSTSSRISVRSKQNSSRPGSRKGKSSLRRKFEKLRQDGAEVRDGSEKESSKSDREPSAISADSGYTADSEIGPLEDDSSPAAHEEESVNLQEVVNPQEAAEIECPSAPDLTLHGIAICSRKSKSATRRHLPPLTPKSLKATAKSSSTPVLTTDSPSTEDKLQGPVSPSFARSVSFADKVEVISPQMIERPASRGGLAFDLQFTPDSGNVKRTPSRLMQMDRKRKCKSTDVLRRELEERMQAAEARKKVCMYTCAVARYG